MKVTCISINQRPDKTAVIAFIEEGKEKNKPSRVINMHIKNSADSKEFQHMGEYELTFKLIKK